MILSDILNIMVPPMSYDSANRRFALSYKSDCNAFIGKIEKLSTLYLKRPIANEVIGVMMFCLNCTRNWINI